MISQKLFDKQTIENSCIIGNRGYDSDFEISQSSYADNLQDFQEASDISEKKNQRAMKLFYQKMIFQNQKIDNHMQNLSSTKC